MTPTKAYESLLDAMNQRFSCRAYDTRQLDDNVLTAVLEAARIAPSACNRQPWQFLVLRNEADRVAVVEAYNRDWIKSAPAFIIAFGDHSQSWHRADGKDHADIDIAIAVEHICLAATTMGLGTCWVCNFNAEVIRQAFNVPDNLEPIAIIPIGYPAEGCPRPEKVRKTSEEIIKWGSF